MSPTFERAVPTSSDLKAAATAINDVLAKHNIPHAFLGGFVMNSLNKQRYTGSIDIEIKSPMFGGWNKIIKLLKETGQYHIMKGNNTVMFPERDGFTKRVRLRLIDMTVGVQIFVLARNQRTPVPCQSIDGLPAYTTTRLLVDKIKCCGRRHHVADAMDIIMLYNSNSDSLSMKVIHKMLTPQDGARAVCRHPHNQSLLLVMQQLQVLSSSYNPKREYPTAGRSWCNFLCRFKFWRFEDLDDRYVICCSMRC